MIDIKELEMLYFSNNEPCSYELKCGGKILIYPIKVKDYQIYEIYNQILQINKNELNDINIVQMSYLQFLVESLFLQDEKYKYQLSWILDKCLRYEYISFEYNKGKIVICLLKKKENDFIIDKIINKKEFDEIIKIILNQNNPNYDDRYISLEVRKMVEEYYKIKYKNTEHPNLEKQKAFVSSKIGITSKDLNELNYREFIQIYQANVDSEIYFGDKIIQASYKYEVKENVLHPLFVKQKDKYEEAFGGDYDQFKKKLEQVNG